MAWLSGWSYRKEITITGQSGAGTNFQVDLDIGDSAGGDFHLEGHCTNFPEDIEVTDNDETTLLKFYIPDKTADPIELWVKVADDLGSNQTIYMYYGKSGASSNSSISDTFISGFDGDSTGWTEVDPNSHISFANNRLEWIGLDRDENAYVYQSASIDDDITVEYTFEITNIYNNGIANLACGGDIIDDFGSLDNGFRSYVGYRSGTTYLGNVAKRVSDSQTSGASINYVVGTQYWVTTTINRSGNAVTKLYSDSDRTNQVGSDSSVDITDLSATLQYMYLISSWNSTTSDTDTAGWLDDFKVRKYIATEPAFSSAGSEETPPTGVTIPVLMHHYNQLTRA